ncbi:MAG: hypothetical protein HY901_35385 [Deltaproteobacteria bacterium]|nr:hypothetical protein [Deltaproteobacteria bacterium]
MLSAALIALSLAASPPVTRAEVLVAQKDAETLFLQFGAVKAGDYSEKDRRRLARLLVKAAEQARKDPMIALGLADKASQLDRTPEAFTLLAHFELNLDQPGAAAGHLDEALALKADYVPARMARAELAVREDDFAVAVDAYERAQKAGAKNVEPLLEKARRAHEDKSRAVEDLRRTEAEIKTKVADAARNATRDWLKQVVADEAESAEKRRLAPDGVRRQELANFVFSYSTGSRRSGDMFAFESKVEKLLERTYDFVADKLGHKRPGRTQVVLMTREEFLAKHAGTPLARAAGYWDGRQIVINGGSQIDERFAQVMVHEFTHAVVTDLAGHGGAPIWMNEGLAENMRLSAVGLRGRIDEGSRALLSALKKQGRLPSIDQLGASFAQMAEGVEASYALSALAAYILVEKRGYSEYIEALQEMKRQRAAQVVERRFMSITELDREIREAL